MSTILSSPVLPRILPFSFEEGSYSPGQYAAAQCMIPEGDFPLQITWLFNNSPLTDSMGMAMGVYITKIGKRSTVLSIDSVAAYNAGDYICKGENAYGSAFYKARLIVNGLCEEPRQFIIYFIWYLQLILYYLVPTP